MRPSSGQSIRYVAIPGHYSQYVDLSGMRILLTLEESAAPADWIRNTSLPLEHITQIPNR